VDDVLGGKTDPEQEQARHHDHRGVREWDPAQSGGPVARDVPQRGQVVDRPVEHLASQGGGVEPGVAEGLPVLPAVGEPLARRAPETGREDDDRVPAAIEQSRLEQGREASAPTPSTSTR
jgi:hypothetical protein